MKNIEINVDMEHGTMSVEDGREFELKLWGIFEVGLDKHIIPTGDKQPHEKDVSCPCNPRVEVEGASLIVVHNSYDYREYIEEAKDIINGEA